MGRKMGIDRRYSIFNVAKSMSSTPMVNGNLFFEFDKSLGKVNKEYKTYLPIDWKINAKTVVQPDLVIVCKKIEKKFLDFTPILVAEILSPSTALKDRNVKKLIYQTQGVKYFLLLNPQT
jgi:Uma2 family endonuclease